MATRNEPIAICARCHTDVMPHHHHAFARGGWQHWSPDDCESAVDTVLRERLAASVNYVDLATVDLATGVVDGAGFTPNQLRALAWRIEHPKGVK